VSERTIGWAKTSFLLNRTDFLRTSWKFGSMGFKTPNFNKRIGKLYLNSEITAQESFLLVNP